MKQQGFTLAEVLITLALIGVVAALTLPGLDSNINSKRIGPSLAKAINNIENANRMTLVDTGATLLNEVTELRGFDGTPKYSDILASRLSGDTEDGPNGTIIFRGKDGITYEISNIIRGNRNTSLPEQYDGRFYRITIDINGAKSPNTGGTDRFEVYSDFKGIVVPAGSKIGKDLTGWSPVLDCNSSDASISAYCTNTVIKDGWTVKYL